MVRKAVILAAGDGTRLGLPIPKALVSLGPEPLLSHTLRALQKANIQEVLIVTGARADRLWTWVSLHRTDFPPLRIALAHNPRWFQTSNGASLLIARDWLDPDEPFLFLMGDHFLAASLFQYAAQSLPEGCVKLVVDRTPGPWLDLREATKVQLRGRQITAIGKHLESYDGIDTGLFLAQPCFLDLLLETQGSITDGVQRAAESGKAYALPVEGALWLDIDTVRDLSRIHALRWNDAHP